MQKHVALKLCLVGVAAATLFRASLQAQTFTPIALAPGTYKEAVVAPANWPYKLDSQSVTVTLTSGPALQTDSVKGFPPYYSVESGEALMEQGFEAGDPTYGMPHGGSTFVSATLANSSNQHVYAVPYWTNYASNCLFLADYTTNGSYNGLPLSGEPYVAQDYTSGNLTLLNATNASFLNSNTYTALSFLATSANGTTVAAVKIACADGSVQTVPIFGIPGFSSTSATNTGTGGGPTATLAWQCNARFDPSENENTYDNTASAIYSIDVGLGDTTSPVTNVSFTFTSGGNGAVFAVSGGINSNDKPGNTGPLTGPFAPIPVAGFNAGCVLASSPLTVAGLAPLTASYANGTYLAGDVIDYFEQGYDLAAPTNGFPMHGSILTSSGHTNRTYQMPASYYAPDSVLVDSSHKLVNITPANTNAAFTAYSFLSSAGNVLRTNSAGVLVPGLMTNYILLQHADGVNESNIFKGYDWYDNSIPCAWNANERVWMYPSNGRTVNYLDAEDPRLFELEFQTYDSSPVTNFVLGYIREPETDSCMFIFAVSATTNLIPVEVGSYTAAQNVYPGASALFSLEMAFGSSPTFQWQFIEGGRTNNLVNGPTGSGSSIYGATTSKLMVSNVTSADVGYYTCLVQNSIPSATNSIEAPLTLLVSSNQAITRPGDLISEFYDAPGTSNPFPAPGLGAYYIIDGTLQPFLNFGGHGPSNTFAGPVGFVIVPSVGQSVITAARVYTSTNSPADDPGDMSIYGSIDGLHWIPIVSTALALPLERNLCAGEINSNNQVLEEIDFHNTEPYLAYAVYFTNTVGGGSATNGVEFAEFQLLGTTTPPPELVWSGVNSSVWDETTRNWNGGTVAYADPDQVQFDDTASSANVIVGATVAPSGILVSNSILNYVFSSSAGKITGYATLTKKGSASLRISDNGVDNFAGGILAGAGLLVLDELGALGGPTVISNHATVQVGNGDASGSLPFGPVVNNGSLIFDRIDNFATANSISGAGTVAHNGSGTNTFLAANTFTGGLAVNSGTLQVASTGNGGTPLGGVAANTTTTAAANVTVNTGATLVGLGADAFGYYANIAPGTLFINGGTVTDVGTSDYRITLPNLVFTGGALVSAPGNTGDANGNYSLLGTAGKCTVSTTGGNASAAITGGIVTFQSPTTFNVAAGTSPTGIDLLVTSELGIYGTDIISIAKAGAGVMEWTGSNVFTAGISNGAGTLMIGGSGNLGGGVYAGAVTNNAVFIYNSSTSQTLSGVFSGAGTLIENGPGALTSTGGLNAAAISIGGSALIMGGSNQMSAGNYTGTIADNAVFTYRSSSAQVISGAISGTGGLNQYGPGKLTLSAANTYTGNTMISNGILTVASSGSLASALIAMTNTGTFDVSGFGSGYVLNAGQTLGGSGSVTGSLTASPASILNAAIYGNSTLRFSNNVVLNGTAVGGATLMFNLPPATNGASSHIAISGLLSLHGTNTIQIAYSTLAAGTYHLITYASESVGAGAQWNLAGFFPSGTQTATIVDTGAGQINLVVAGSAATLAWLGDGSANLWDISSLNWSNQAAEVTTTFSTGELVTFNNNGSENPLLPVQLVGSLFPGAVLVSNTGYYVFSNNGSLGGETALTKLGSGALALLETGGDNFSGGILLGGGSLTLSNTGVNLVGGVTVTNGALTLAYSGTIAGGLSMTHPTGSAPSALIVGPGTLNGGITAAGSLVISNNPIINGGLVANNGSTLLDQTTTPSGNTTIASGVTVQVGNRDANGNLPSGTVADSGSLIFNQTASVTVPNVISGSGTLSQVGGNVLTLSGASTAYTGAMSVTNGVLKATVKSALGAATASATITNNGTLDVNGIAYNSGQAALLISGAGFGGGGALVNTGAAQTAAFSNLTVTGNVTLGGPQRWDLRAGTGTAAALNTKPAGSPYSITKVGTNEIALVNVGTVDAGLGNIDVQQGELSVQYGTSSLGNPASNLLVRAGAALDVWDLTNALNKVIALNGSGTNHTFFAEAGLAGQNNIIGPVTLNGNCWFDVSNGVFATMGGVIGGAGNLILVSPGTLTLTNHNTYTGATIISNGTLALVNGGSLSGTSGLSIAGGGTLDVSALGSATAFMLPGTSFTAGGATAATIVGAASGTVNFGSVPLTLTCGESSPALSIAQGTLQFNGNDFTVNTTNGAALPLGTYVLISQTNGNMGGSVAASVVGTAIPSAGAASFVSIRGGNVVLNIVNVTPPGLSFSVSGQQLTLSWPSDHLGWTLQTNAGDLSKASDWFPYPGSSAVTGEIITVGQSPASVFFRLVDQ